MEDREKNLKLNSKAENNVRNQSQPNSEEVKIKDGSSSAIGKNIWQKIAEFPAMIFKKGDKEALLSSMNEIVDDCESYGVISSEEKKMIKSIINIGNVRVDDIMIPRTDVVAINENTNLKDIKTLLISKEHSRIPIYQDNLDKIIGFIHSKDLVKFIDATDSDFKISNIMRKIIYIPNSMRIIDLLLKMRASRIHIAVVLDEYGGTDGLVTIEDIMEEIVGEIEDEYDTPDNNIYTRIKKISDNVLHVGGRVEIKTVSELLGMDIFRLDEDDDFDTVGGLILAALKKVPEVGEVVKYSSGLVFKVLDADMRSIKLVEITKDSEKTNDNSN